MKISINLIPIAILLSSIFAVLKLFGAITWSWGWVFSPIWITLLASFAIIIILTTFLIAFGFLAWLVKP